MLSAVAGLLIAPVGYYFARSLSFSCQDCQILDGHTNSVQTVAFSPDGKFLASAGLDRTIIMREKADLTSMLKKPTGHKEMITDLAFSDDGKTLVSVDWNGKIYIWDTDNLEESKSILSHGKEGVVDVEISPDGEYLVAASIYHPENLVLWRLASGEEQRVTVEGLSHIAFVSEDGMLAAVASDEVYLWPSLESNSVPVKLNPETEGHIMSLALSRDGRRLLGIGRNRIVIWDLLNLDLPPTTLEDSGSVYSLSFDTTGRYLAAGGPHPQVSIYDLNEFK